MARGSQIIVSAAPGGRFLEGIVSGTPKPGTCMQVKAATPDVSGAFTWEVFNQAADGTNALVAVLLEKDDVGLTKDDAYVTGERCKLYCPLPGEELNMLKGDVAGTGDDFAIADRLMIDDTTGKVIASTGSEASTPFICLETVTDPTADQHVHCMFTGQ